jgi:hypothetical protein
MLSGSIAAQVAIIGRRSFLSPLLGAVRRSLVNLEIRLQR